MIISIVIKKVTERKIITLLSFASKMGALIYGKEKLERHLHASRLKILFIASDCSNNTKKMWVNKCDSNHAKLILFQNTTKKELAKRLGKKELSAVSTSNEDILKGVLKYLEKT